MSECRCILVAESTGSGFEKQRTERIVHCPLHAAAPDLLAALEGLVSQSEWPIGCHFCIVEVGGAGNPRHEPGCPMQLACKAIEKALPA